MRNQIKILIISIIILSVLGIFSDGLHINLKNNSAYAATADELQGKINSRNEDIKNLEKEIAGYQSQIDDLGKQANTLQSTIQSLSLTEKKLNTNIKLTQDKIAAKNLEIQKLSGQIGNKQENIDDDRRIIAQALISLNRVKTLSVERVILSSESVSDVIKKLNDLSTLEGELHQKINDLRTQKTSLETNKKATEQAKADLDKLKADLDGQRKAVLATTAEKNNLLKSTKQSEGQYKNMLSNKLALKEAFESEVKNYESQLNLIVNPSLIPHTGSGILSYPLDNVKITQYFGNTPFSTANPQVYNGMGHNGVDFKASIGTPIKAALGGTVAGTANMDLVPGCYSYGQWVMVKHNNGLSTLYAHLSVISVQKGQEVTTGQILGYSGNTGYTTGPHLHFGVYATQGVKITTFDNSKNCKGALVPLADPKAYLNPLSYL